MKLEKISLLVNWNLYEVKRHFVQKLAEAMNRRGIETQIIDHELYGEDTATWILDVVNFAPDCTCSFNSLLPFPDGSFLCGQLQIPHVALLVDPAPYSFHLIRSPYCIASCVDRGDCTILHALSFPHVFFFPHAVERELALKEDNSFQERPYDVVFFGSCNDYEDVQKERMLRFPSSIQEVMKTAIQMVLSPCTLSLFQILLQAFSLHQISLSQEGFFEVYKDLDTYTRGKDRVELVRAIRDPHIQVHIFGQSDNSRHPNQWGWQEYLNSQSNVILHPPVTYLDSLQILQQSKICLNSMPFFKDGTHERIFAGLACGSLPMTSSSLYLQENFVAGEELLMYTSGQWDEVNEQIVHFIQQENKRKEAVERGREKVKQFHTWDQRIDTLILEMSKINL